MFTSEEGVVLRAIGVGPSSASAAATGRIASTDAIRALIPTLRSAVQWRVAKSARRTIGTAT
jgi:hypothetical protein